ncbi:MAG: cbb3-type cytochrome c oxidase subunit I, partial [Candidatus Kuenenia stuttgartiensis]|nr:cbb3-type cytochrome c oxidase subunit I [Candidatus Kuenenia stuttgartiensis]
MGASNVDTSNRIQIEYDDKIARMFTIATIVWAAIAFTIGVFVAFQIAVWQLNFNTGWLTYGRLRPVHTNANIFAFAGNAIFAGIY